ncbi:TPA: hypothetical protein SL363_003010 [Pseudomonas aeruginosa]|uniref:hypothetical protein n=2 Tax=Pseudomonas aeruginosa TaxID=287 RepID=UPI00066AD05E|nr:hypothetical protein [Pseudomonas aeruginosa]ELL4385940.1 hypothetical protein [Pseudomonas aeruginosa]KSR24235.1 hypothetical protein APB48_26810 [Pseudomonas aeruginosa]KXD76644.1 hypothetical protein AW914_23650 [Pseudomonas aeruginosa]KXD86973.1 hypothetical protein AW915_23720 [Pseudomonas aeruginosa]KXE02903.1 hypothetical protein AW916_23765 [Pseudomonas aeruginosa]
MARPKKTADQSSTVSVSLRVDPSIKYAIDIAARVQKRTVTGVVEWSVDRALSEVKMPVETPAHADGKDREPMDVMSAVKENLWSSNEAIRFIKLASQYPSLLTFDENLMWDSIRLSPVFWRWLPRIRQDADMRNIRQDILTEYWDVFLDRFNNPGGKVVILMHEDLGIPSPREIEEKKWQMIDGNSSYLEELERKVDDLQDKNETLVFVAKSMKQLLMKINPEVGALVKDEDLDAMIANSSLTKGRLE